MGVPTSSTPLVHLGHNNNDNNNNERASHWTFPLISSVFVCCLSCIQYGFHMAELNAPARYIRLSLGLSQSQLGLVTSIFSIGGLLSSTFASYLSTRHGLKISFIVTSISYTIGSFIESRTNDFNSLMVGRFISGIGGGLAIVYVPIYVNDISPVELRGILGSMTQISVNFGILLTQVLAIYWGDMQQWRFILAIGCMIGFLNLILILCGGILESPKWLLIRSPNNTELNENIGKEILSQLRGNKVNLEELDEEINIWKTERQKHVKLIESNPHLKNLGFWYYLTDYNYFNSRMIATFMMLGQQFSGINSVIFYGVDILNKVFPTHSVLVNVFISIGNLIITSISSVFLDRIGRKPLLLISLLAMTLMSIGISIGILIDNPVLTVLSIFSYVGSFAIGCGPIPFLIVSEVSQTEVKDIAQSWATDCNWLSVFIVGTVFPILNGIIGGWTYLIFAGVSLVFALFVQVFVPETKGKQTYADVWGVNDRND